MNNFNVGEWVMWSGPLAAPRPQLVTILEVHTRGAVYTIRPDGGEPRATQNWRLESVDTWMCEVCEDWFPEEHMQDSEGRCSFCVEVAS